MKKVFNSFYVLMLLFLSSCASNENVDTTPKGTGELIAKINFSQAQGTRATNETAESNAIPITSWSNVKDLQLFLYDSSNGKVAFSAIFTPSNGVASGEGKIFTWTNVPKGTYKLALVANINAKSTNYNIRTTLNGTATVPDWTTLTSSNILGKSLTTPEIYADLSTTSFPFPENHVWDTSNDHAYFPPSEIFTAYSSSDVVIEEGKTTTEPKNNDGSSITALSLTRAISLMRVRVNKEDKDPGAPHLSFVDFKNEKSFIAVHRLPKGLKLDGTGVFQDSDKDRILIGATGTTTFETGDPDSNYKNLDGSTPAKILKGDYKLWKDIFVLPNTKGTQATKDDAVAARKYFIVIAGWAPKGYVFADGTTVTGDGGKAVYWSGTINGVFSPNVIREVNLNITSPGSPTNPTDPDQVGGLTITVGTPLDWNSIVSETIEL